MQTDTRQTIQQMTWTVASAVYKCPYCQRVQVAPADEAPTCTSYWVWPTGDTRIDDWRKKTVQHPPRQMEQIDAPAPDGQTPYVWECGVCHIRVENKDTPCRARDQETWKPIPGMCDHSYTTHKGEPLGMFLPVKIAMTGDDAMLRWPRLVSHLICTSLGYFTPEAAAECVAGVWNGTNGGGYCEWISSCHKGDSLAPVIEAFQGRKHHTGFMAHYPQAAGMVLVHLYNRYVRRLGRYEPPLLASWF